MIISLVAFYLGGCAVQVTDELAGDGLDVGDVVKIAGWPIYSGITLVKAYLNRKTTPPTTPVA